MSIVHMLHILHQFITPHKFISLNISIQYFDDTIAGHMLYRTTVTLWWYIPLRSFLMSSMRGTVLPSLFLPSPSPLFQPIRSNNSFPIPACTGAAVFSWSYNHTQTAIRTKVHPDRNQDQSSPRPKSGPKFTQTEQGPNFTQTESGPFYPNGIRTKVYKYLYAGTLIL